MLDDNVFFRAKRISYTTWMNRLSVCNYISEHSNISQFHMWPMPSEIHFSNFQFQFKLPCPVLLTTFLCSIKYLSVWFQEPYHLLTYQAYWYFHNTHYEHLMVAKPSLTLFDSTGDFSNRLRNRSKKKTFYSEPDVDLSRIRRLYLQKTCRLTTW